MAQKFEIWDGQKNGPKLPCKLKVQIGPKLPLKKANFTVRRFCVMLVDTTTLQTKNCKVIER